MKSRCSICGVADATDCVRCAPPIWLDQAYLEALWEVDELTPAARPIAPYPREGRRRPLPDPALRQVIWK